MCNGVYDKQQTTEVSDVPSVRLMVLCLQMTRRAPQQQRQQQVQAAAKQQQQQGASLPPQAAAKAH
jgi:hypothetical protein